MIQIALVNTNRMKPPIAPIGLEYVAEALDHAGFKPHILDLCWEEDWEFALSDFFCQNRFDFIGLSLRNTDDCAAINCQCFLPEFSSIAKIIRQHSQAPVVAGGVGFSVMPELVLDIAGLDAGIWGEGEFIMPRIASHISEKKDWRDLPNLVIRQENKWHRNPLWAPSLASLPPMSRKWVDNVRYFREGGQAGVETKRGCPQSCIYCADPLAKGKIVRVRPPESVVFELENLLSQGIDHVHTCDCEFNIPEAHAKEVCLEMIRKKLGEKLRWYAYCAPKPFSEELATLMRRAGCVGINFGTDSGDEKMLRNLKRSFLPRDIETAVLACKKEGIAVMIDLLIGAPGETRQSIQSTIELMKRIDPDRIGVVIGVRVYPGTELEIILKQNNYDGVVRDPDDPAAPVVFLESAVAPFVFDFVDKLIGQDKRFFFFDPTKPDKNYNYNANQKLLNALEKGYKGAYWDILRRFG